MVIKEQGNKPVYSDGDETERNMMKIASEYPEDMAEDYIARNSSYTVNNTFSAVRQNILNWYPFDKDAEILEVGAGMGAITGMLCERAKRVVAIEMNQVRAEIIRTRYAKRDNLQVLSEDINTWQTEQTFDYIVFIGVLEYAAVFLEGENPYDQFLKNIRRRLRPTGKILFAIENRFGLKYWLGASEDHLQQPFVGIRGYENTKTPRTFSKQELSQLLERAGFMHYRFYAALPDYKFPELIFSEDYKPDYMNLKKISFTYSKGSVLTANEKDLYKDIIENGVFSFFANSYLIEASSMDLGCNHVVQVSAKSEVYKEYRVSTVMYSDGSVYKVPMHRNASQHLRDILRNTRDLEERGIQVLPLSLEGDKLVSKKFEGPSAQDIFKKALEGNDRETLHRQLDCLRDNLIKSSELIDYSINNILALNGLDEAGVQYGPVLQRAYIDMTFYNSFWVDNALVFYDQEWCFERVPLHFCLYYTLKSAYYRSDVDTKVTFEELLEYLEIRKKEIASYDKLEEFIWSKILYRQTDFYGEDGYCNRYNDQMTLHSRKEQHEKEIQLKERQIAQLQEEAAAQDEHLKQLNIEIAQKGERIVQLQEETATRDEHLKQLNIEIAQKGERIVQLQEEVEERNEHIRNKEGHIEQLLEVEREYEREKNSRTYRLALKFRKVSLYLFPIGSKRRFLAKLACRVIRHPIYMLKLVNARRIRNGITVLKTEGGDSAETHLHLVEEYEKSVEVPLPEGSQISLEPSDPEKKLEDYEKMIFRKWNNPMVSIVIPAYNQFDYTYYCLQSVLKNSGDITYEIILADDHSADLTSRIEEIVEGVTVIHNRENLGFLLNCNHAAQYAKGKYILFLNNDTQVQSNWLSPLVQLLERNTEIGMTGAKLIYPDGHLQEAGGILWKDASAWNYGNRQNPNDPEFNYIHETDYISGAAIMLRTSLWREIGGFDIRYTPAYCEDSDLAFEVRKHGYKVVYQPQSGVMHFEGISNGTDLEHGQKKYQIENQKKFYAKWKEVLEKEHFENGQDVFVARDRSRNQKHVLVIDHYVPQYDKDAGSKTTFMYLKMLVQKGYHITFLGDNFYQHEPYTTELQQMGIFVLYGPKYAEHWKEWLLENMPFFDVFYLNRPHITIKYIDLIKKHASGRVIYYGHDLHFLRTRREYELSGAKNLLEESEEWLRKETYIMRRADMNYFPSEIECDAIHKLDPSIPVKAITAYVYEDFPKVEYDYARRQGLLFVGGFGHGPNVDAVKWFLEKIYPDVYRRIQADFYIVGSRAPEEITRIQMDGVVMKGFVSEEELRNLYAFCRIAVVPLRYGAGVKGKVVEALYYGLPVITTSIGAEGIPGIEGIVSIQDTETAISDAICDLYGNSEKLSEMSEKSSAFVRTRFSTDAVWNIIQEDFS